MTQLKSGNLLNLNIEWLVTFYVLMQALTLPVYSVITCGKYLCMIVL